MTAPIPRSTSIAHRALPEDATTRDFVPIVVHVESRKIARRIAPDRSQRVRRLVQWASLALNLYLGAQFYLWVRCIETSAHAPRVPRPPGIEGWLPIVGLMNTRYFLGTGRVPEVHPAAMFLFMAFVLSSLVLKRSFCSWICPIGTVSEWLWQGGQKLFGHTLRPPRWIDVPLRGLKYLLLGFFVVSVGTMSAAAIGGFMRTPFGLIADVKLLDFFRDIGWAGIGTLALLALLSMLVQNFWCRYLCPYGALMGVVSLLSPFKIRRDAQACIDCGKCARACPAGLPVSRLTRVRSAECTACMRCVASCPVAHGLQFAVAPRTAPDAARRERELQAVLDRTGRHAAHAGEAFGRAHLRQPLHRQSGGTGARALAAVDAG